MQGVGGVDQKNRSSNFAGSRDKLVAHLFENVPRGIVVHYALFAAWCVSVHTRPFCFGLPMPFLLRPGEPQPAARRSAPAGRHEGNGRPKTASPPATHAWLDCRGREHKQFLWRRTSLLRPDHHEECGRSQPQGCAAITETDGWWWGTEHLHPHLHPGG